MKKTYILILNFIILTGTSNINKAFSEHIFLKDGSIIEGRVIRQTAGSLTIKTPAGKTRVFRNRNVMRVLYTKFYMGRQYIRLTDGRVFQAYKVDEDRDSITFRKDLHKPNEFKIKRTKLLFMARKNPNELKGKADLNEISINWKPPMGTVKAYRIYLKEKFKKYPKEAITETKNLKHTITKLKSSTDYCVVVTAMDEEKKESLPSNEVCLSTKNLGPEGIKYFLGRQYIDRKKEKRIEAHIKWKRASDPDGSITDYKIYIKENRKSEFKRKLDYKVPESMKDKKIVQWKLSGLEDDNKYTVKIQAIDNRGAASPFSDEYTFSTKNRQPNYPRSLIIDKIPGKGKSVSYKITWDRAVDPDGVVVNYEIYIKKGNTLKKVGESNTEKFVINGFTNDSSPNFGIRAVDNRGAFSENSLSLSHEFVASMYGAFLLPMGNLSDMYGPGGGQLVSFLYRGFPMDEINLGLKAGYFIFTGADDAYGTYTMIPVLLSAEYDFIFGSWDLSVSLSGGMSYSIVNYNRYIYEDGLVYVYDVPGGTKKSFQSLVMAGLKFGYTFDIGFHLSSSVEYGGIIEKSSILHFLSFSLGLGMVF